MKSRAALLRARLNEVRYLRLKALGDFRSLHLFAMSGFTPQGNICARHPNVWPEPPADPFTGSATGALAAYVWRYKLSSRRNLVVQQGHDLGRPGVARVEGVTSSPDLHPIRVTGEAVTVFEGLLPNLLG